MSDALLAEIVANLDDDGPRAVWADQLLEQEDPWGEFIHLQLAVARGGDTVRALHQARLVELFEGHHAAHEPPPRQGTHWLWRRGFLDQVSTSPADFAAVCELAPTLRILETAVGTWVERTAYDRVRRADTELRRFAELLASPKFARLEGLIVHASMTYEDHEHGEVGFWGNITPAREEHDLGNEAVELLTSIALPRLHMLGISPLTYTGLSMLAESPLAARLDRLVAPWLTADQLQFYLDHPTTCALRGLVCGEWIDHPKLARLEEISTRAGKLPPAGIRRSTRVEGRWDAELEFDDWTFRPCGPF